MPPACFARALRVAPPLALRISARAPPPLRDAPLPTAHCSRSSRAYSRSFRVFLRSRIPPRAFAPCFCAASHAPNLAARAPRAAPRAPRAGLVTSRHLPLVLPLCTCVFALRLPCCCGCALRTYARSPRRAPPHSLHRPSLDLWHSRSLHLRALWLFTCSLRCWRSAMVRLSRLRPLHRPRPRPALRRLAISAAAALRSFAPLARTVLAALR